MSTLVVFNVPFIHILKYMTSGRKKTQSLCLFLLAVIDPLENRIILTYVSSMPSSQ